MTFKFQRICSYKGKCLCLARTAGVLVELWCNSLTGGSGGVKQNTFGGVRTLPSKDYNWKGISFSDIICYESSIPKIVREFVRRGSELLIIQANDGWLGNSYGPYQHFELARLRAIENRIPILRSANTGISGVIRSDGTIQTKIGLNKQSMFQEVINISKSGSIYSSYGDIFAIVCFLITLLISLLSCKKRFI